MILLVSLALVLLAYSSPRTGLAASLSSQPTHRRGIPLVEEPLKVDVKKLGNDREEQNVAGEDKDEPEEAQKGTVGSSGDSNNASEERNEGATGLGAGPPADGSIKFHGPQNERQRAVVAAFQHAWQVQLN
jgi:hypothetical protein